MARPILLLQATKKEVVELGRLVRGTKVSVGDELSCFDWRVCPKQSWQERLDAVWEPSVSGQSGLMATE
jgi:hypothetical protein